MNAEIAVTKPKRWGRRIAKFLLWAVVLLVIAYWVATLVWRFSGSNTWEFVGEKNGVKVYSLKSPGTDTLQVKGITRVRSTLAGLVAFMQDAEVCSEIGCSHSRMVERVDDQLQYYTFRYEYPLRFKPRDFVVKAQFHQDPKTRNVLLQFDAVPDKLPLQDCCFRVTDMNNVWWFKPLGDGQVELEYTMNMSEGGYIPHFLLNSYRPEVMFEVLPALQKLLEREKYQSAKYDFIVEK